METRNRRRGIVVAVDFGTTFSGVAWAKKTNVGRFTTPNYGCI